LAAQVQKANQEEKSLEKENQFEVSKVALLEEGKRRDDDEKNQLVQQRNKEEAMQKTLEKKL